MLQYGMRQTAEVTSQMTSVERILQYTKLEKEGPFKSEPAKKPHRDWPQNGAITFEKIFLSYSDDGNAVLKDLSFEIKPGEKVSFSLFSYCINIKYNLKILFLDWYRRTNRCGKIIHNNCFVSIGFFQWLNQYR